MPRFFRCSDRLLHEFENGAVTLASDLGRAVEIARSVFDQAAIRVYAIGVSLEGVEMVSVPFGATLKTVPQPSPM